MARRSLAFLVPLLASALVGCGGGGGGSSSRSSTRVTFVAGSTYNGSKDPLLAAPTGGSSNETTNLYVQVGTRTLKLRLRAIQVDPGQTFEVGAANTAAYDEDETAYWTATGGTLTVTAVEHGRATLRLDGVTFVRLGTIDGNPAAGGFTLSGRIVDAPFDFDNR